MPASPVPNPFPYHHQDTINFCGPACVMMTMHSRGISLAGMKQSDLFLQIDAAPGAKPGDGFFASAPPGLAWAMSERLKSQPIPKISYAVHSKPSASPQNTPEKFSKKIRDCLDSGGVLSNFRAPVVALAGKHWILIYDWFLNAAGEREYRFRSPSFNGGGQQSVHSGAGVCAPLCTGGSDEKVLESTLHADVAPATDAESVKSGVASRYGFWEGRRVLLVPTIELPAGRYRMAMAPRRGASAGTRVAITAKGVCSRAPKLAMAAKPKRCGKAGVPPPDETGRKPREPVRSRSPLTGVQAVELIQGKLADFAGTWPEHEARLGPEAKVLAALRVDRLDAPEDSYYLVPVVAKETGAFLLASVSISTGSVDRAAAAIVSKTGISSPGWLTEMPVSGMMSKFSRCARELQQRDLVFTGRLVWQPCFESPSPLYPFAELQEGENIRFLDFRGCVHDKLTTDGGP